MLCQLGESGLNTNMFATSEYVQKETSQLSHTSIFSYDTFSVKKQESLVITHSRCLSKKFSSLRQIPSVAGRFRPFLEMVGQLRRQDSNMHLAKLGRPLASCVPVKNASRRMA